MFEAIKRFFSGETENIHDLIVQSEHKASGWYRQNHISGDFLGYVWACPGKVIRSTMPRPKGSTKPGEAPVEQRIGCNFETRNIPVGLRGLEGVRAKCRQCGTSSSLLQYLKERGLEPEQLAVKVRTTPATRDRIIDTWGKESAEPGYAYEGSDPGGLF